jgi:hypothetical protein
VESDRKKQLNNLLHSFNLTSIITIPTRVQNKSVTIDNIFIDPSRFEEYSVTPISNGLSDHDAQLLTIRQIVSPNLGRNLITTRKFDNYSISEFIDKLSNESWDNIFYNEDINVMFNSFLNNYLRIFNLCFPLQTVMTKNNFIKTKWITKGIKISCNNKRKLYLSYSQNPNEETKRHYRLYSKILTNVVKEAKKKYNTKVSTSSKKTKAAWDIINETGHRHTKIALHDLKVDHKHVTNPEEIAETFNNYFSLKENDNIKFKSLRKMSSETKVKCYFNQSDKLYSPSFVLKTFSTREISCIINSIKTKNTHGYDEVSTKILKISSNYITSPLTHICNRIILSGSFPERLKFSIAKPVYKKGDRKNCSIIDPSHY